MKKAGLYVASNPMQSRDAEDTLKELCSQLNWSEGERVLDVGCGPGNVTATILLPYLPSSVSLVGSDISEEMVDYANTNFSNDRITFKKMDIQHNNLWDIWKKQSFDKIFSFYCLHWVQNQRQSLYNIHSLLKPGGEVFLVFLAHSPIYTLYEKLYMSPKWKIYMKNINKYISPYHKSENPALEFSQLLKDTQFENMKCINKKTSFTYSSWRSVICSIQAVNPFTNDIPKELQEEYVKCIEDIIIRENLAELNNETGKVQVHYTLIVAMAAKMSPDICI